jgi:NAD-dependent SIR2 family protein deacetylase
LAAVAASKQATWKCKRDEGISKGSKGKETDYKGKGTIPKCKTCGSNLQGDIYKNKRVYFNS